MSTAQTGELTYDTAAALVSAQVPAARPDELAADVRKRLEGSRFECATEVAICEDGRLQGLVRVEDLLAARASASMASIMDADPPVVAPGLDQEIAAWKAVKHGEGSLAVVDATGMFVGLIPPGRLLGVLLREHDEDIARLGGFLRGTATARASSEEPVGRRLWHRLPWLFVGLVGAVIAADIVGAFEGRLEDNVLLAFFMPGIVYLADAVGTQTEALVIRGLSVGVDVRRVVLRELATGVLAGAALGLAFFPVGVLRWGETDVALAVSLSLVAACSIATAVAMALPWLLSQAGRDPAFGSGPLATVIQDLLSIVVYLGIVVLVVG